MSKDKSNNSAQQPLVSTTVTFDVAKFLAEQKKADEASRAERAKKNEQHSQFLAEQRKQTQENNAALQRLMSVFIQQPESGQDAATPTVDKVAAALDAQAIKDEEQARKAAEERSLLEQNVNRLTRVNEEQVTMIAAQKEQLEALNTTYASNMSTLREYFIDNTQRLNSELSEAQGVIEQYQGLLNGQRQFETNLLTFTGLVVGSRQSDMAKRPTTLINKATAAMQQGQSVSESKRP
jgi:hypothetical protein